MSYGSRESSRYIGAPVKLFLVQGADPTGDSSIGPYAYCDGEVPIVREGISYTPWPIKHSDTTQDGTLDKSDVTVSLALGTPIDELFLAYPPSQVVNMTIFEGHIGDDVTTENYPAIWIGRILGAEWRENELDLSCLPVSASIKRPGLRRNYQIGCPHVLFGPQCGASKAAATVLRHATGIDRNQITIDTALGANYAQYIGGLLEWTNVDDGRKEIRTISDVSSSQTVLTIRGVVRGIWGSTSLSIIRGCNRQMIGCNQHNNILNFGGQPFIPSENPLSQKNQFY